MNALPAKARLPKLRLAAECHLGVKEAFLVYFHTTLGGIAICNKAFVPFLNPFICIFV